MQRLRVRTIFGGIYAVLGVLNLVFLGMLYFITQADEQNRVAILAPRIARALEAELLLNDEEGIRIVKERTKAQYHFLNLTLIPGELKQCKAVELGCWDGYFSLKNEPFTLNIRFESNVGIQVVRFGAFFLLVTMALYFLLNRLIHSLIEQPLSHVVHDLIPQLRNVASGLLLPNTVDHVGRYRSFEIHAVADALCTMATEVALTNGHLLESQRKHAISESVARTTQALAHDVRKPFTILKMLIDTIVSTENPEEIREIMAEALPEVQQAMAVVNGMISDVMEIGSQSSLSIQNTDPSELIDAAVHETLKIYPHSQIHLTYNLRHRLMVGVDASKVARVFANILDNALQAMNQKGRIWLETHEVTSGGQTFVQFCIGNSDSSIPEENIPRLFDAFFTAEKKGGTGLGLAIAQTIIHAHGGNISCHSVKEKGVEFKFTLPASIQLKQPRSLLLPEMSSALPMLIERPQAPWETGKPETKILAPSPQSFLPEFAVVDDSPLILLSWERKSKSQAKIHTFESPESFWRSVDLDPSLLERLSCVVTDNRFLPGCRDTGITFGVELKKVFSRPIFLSSDDEFRSEDLSSAVDKTIPKSPLSWGEMSKLLNAGNQISGQSALHLN